jgi:hypothetical protein
MSWYDTAERILHRLPDTSKEEAVVVAERIRQEIEKRISQQENLPHGRLTASIGIASFPEDGHTFTTLVLQRILPVQGEGRRSETVWNSDNRRCIRTLPLPESRTGLSHSQNNAGALNIVQNWSPSLRPRLMALSLVITALIVLPPENSTFSSVLTAPFLKLDYFPAQLVACAHLDVLYFGADNDGACLDNGVGVLSFL